MHTCVTISTLNTNGAAQMKKVVGADIGSVEAYAKSVL